MEGCSISSIAQELGCPKSIVSIEVHRLGLYGQVLKPYQDPDWLYEQKSQGKTDTEIALELGVTNVTVSEYRRRFGIPKNPKTALLNDADWLKDQRALGRTDKEISEELGCHSMTVYNARKRQGIP